MSILTFIQAVNLIYLIAIRPYEIVKDLIFETMSQTIMTLFSGLLINFNTIEQSNSFINWVFIGTLMSSSAISSLISFIDLFILIWGKCKKYRCKKSKVDTRPSRRSLSLNVNEPNAITNIEVENSKIDNDVNAIANVYANTLIDINVNSKSISSVIQYEEEKTSHIEKEKTYPIKKKVKKHKRSKKIIVEKQTKQSEDYDYLDSVINMERS